PCAARTPTGRSRRPAPRPRALARCVRTMVHSRGGAGPLGRGPCRLPPGVCPGATRPSRGAACLRQGDRGPLWEDRIVPSTEERVIETICENLGVSREQVKRETSFTE